MKKQRLPSSKMSVASSSLPGNITLLLGPPGCGKTTFFLALSWKLDKSLKPCIVYLGGHTADTKEYVVEDFHNELLGSILKDKEKAKAAIYYYYKYHINAFAANLEEEEANAVSKHPRVVSVFPSKTRTLHTTRSSEFMGLENPGGKVPQTSLWK